MSKRQPTIEIDNQTIAHDEIAGVIDLKSSLSLEDKQKTPILNAIKLVNGTIIPLSPQKFNRVINFIRENER